MRKVLIILLVILLDISGLHIPLVIVDLLHQFHLTNVNELSNLLKEAQLNKPIINEFSTLLSKYSDSELLNLSDFFIADNKNIDKDLSEELISVLRKLEQSRPDLKNLANELENKFTSESFEDVVNRISDEISPKIDDSISFLKRSPLARNTEEAITKIVDEAPTALNQAEKLVGNLKSGIESTVAPFSSKEALSASFTNYIIQPLIKLTNTEFQSFLQQNPDFKLSTSDYVQNYIKNTIIPDINEKSKVLEKSPLAQNIEYYSSTPTSFIFEQALSTALKTSSPILNFGERIVERLVINPTVGVISELDSAISETFEQAVNEVTSIPTIAPISDIQKLSTESLSVPLPDVKDLTLTAVNKVQSAVSGLGDAITTRTIPSIIRNSETFGDNLRNSIITLSTKSAETVTSGLVSVGETLQEISEVSGKAPKVTTELVGEVAVQIPTLPTKISTTILEGLDTLDNRIIGGVNTLKDASGNQVNEIKQWRLFNDEQLATIQRINENTKQLIKELGSKSTKEEWNDLVDVASGKWQLAQQRFAEINDQNVAKNSVALKVKDLSVDLYQITQKAVDQAVETVKSPEFQKDLQSKLDQIKETSEEIGKVLKEDSNQLLILGQKLSNSLTKDVNELVQESKTYVKNFLDTNEELSN